MKQRSLGFAFVAAVLAWSLVYLYIAPQFNGADVAIFRDAGSNLALTHHFESPGLPYVRDLRPRLFAHYTPLTPLAYGIFASIFPFGPKTATFFWFVLGCVLAGIALFLIQKSGLRSFVARSAVLFVLISLPETFFEKDRPEAVGLILLILAIISGLRNGAGPLILSSIFVGLTFLAHPFAGILAALWMAAIRSTEVLERKATVVRGVAKLLLCGAISGAMILLTVLWYRAADPTAIQRFLNHAFHQGRGLGQTPEAGNPAPILAKGIFSSIMAWIAYYQGSFNYVISTARTISIILGASTLCLILWWLRVGKANKTPAAGMAILACLISIGLTLAIFPFQLDYFLLVAGVLAFGCAAMGVAYKSSRLAELGCLLFAIIGLLRTPSVAAHILIRAENRSSYLQTLSQPDHLLPLLPSPNAIVVIRGGEYDVFKPKIRNLVQAFYLADKQDLSAVGGIINCYDNTPGTSSFLLTIPPPLDPSQFRLIERSPAHTWITLFGRRVSESQWGWGCDLYTRSAAFHQVEIGMDKR